MRRVRHRAAGLAQDNPGVELVAVKAVGIEQTGPLPTDGVPGGQSLVLVKSADSPLPP